MQISLPEDRNVRHGKVAGLTPPTQQDRRNPPDNLQTLQIVLYRYSKYQQDMGNKSPRQHLLKVNMGSKEGRGEGEGDNGRVIEGGYCVC